MFEALKLALARQSAGTSLAPSERAHLLSQLERQGLPGLRDEAWRYAPLQGITRQALVGATGSATEARDDIRALLPTSPDGFARCIIIDGAYASALSSNDSNALRCELVATSTPASVADSAATLADNGFALLTRLLAAKPVRLELTPRSTNRWHVIFVSTSRGNDGLAPSALRIDVTGNLCAEIVEEHVALSGRASFAMHEVQTSLGSGSQLRWTRLLRSAPDARQVETVGLRLADAAAASVRQIAPGNAALRSTVVATLQGRGASLDFDSVAVGEGSQHLDQHVLIDHVGPQTKSREVFRGLAAGRARVAFTGHNRAQVGATNTDLRQSLRALITGAEAEAIARPQLEILTDAVQASHGATVGTLDPQMLFYLLSRGLDPEAAQSLLKWAFLQDVIARIEPAALRTRIETLLLARLHDPRLAELTA